MKNTENAVSATALLIAKALVFLTHDKRHGSLVPQAVAEASCWFIEDLAVDKSFFKLVKKPYFRFAMRVMERVMVPGTILHFALRKRFFEEQTREAINNGVKQVVILAGGLDTLAFRLHKEFPEVQFLEIDRPDSQNAKKNTLQRHTTLAGNYIFLGADLADASLPDILAASPQYKRDKPTLYLAEGLTMYLPEKSVRQLFASIQETLNIGGKFVFTYIREISPRKDLSAKISDSWLAKRKEIYRWSVSDHGLRDLLREYNMTLTQHIEYAALQQPYVSAGDFKKLKKVRGEHMAIAIRN